MPSPTTPQDDLLEFALKLRTLRAAKKISQRELGKKSDIPQATIWHYEKALRKPLWKHIQGLCRAFNVSPEAFADEHGH